MHVTDTEQPKVHFAGVFQSFIVFLGMPYEANSDIKGNMQNEVEVFWCLLYAQHVKINFKKITFKNGFRDSIIGKSVFLVPRINTHKTCKNSQDRLNTVSTPIPVNPSSSEANKFFCNSVFK